MRTERKKVLILAFSDLSRDPRVYRQIRFLSSDYDVAALGRAAPDSSLDVKKFYHLRPKLLRFEQRWLRRAMLKARRFDAHYWSDPAVEHAYVLLRRDRHDLILANDLATVPLALRLSAEQGTPVLGDLHEYEPRHFDDKWFFNFFYRDYYDYLCRAYLPKAAALTTVCDGIAEEYCRNYGVRCSVITNAPFYAGAFPIRSNGENIRLIHHGYVNRSRRLENMVYLMDQLDDRFTLDFMLLEKNPKELAQFRKLAAQRPRIRFREPVPMHQIVESIREYDIGLFLLAPNAFNYRMALPNKLFEFIQASLAVAIWPSPEMARLVEKYRLGIVSKDYDISSIAQELNALDESGIWKMRVNASTAARELCAENNRKALLEQVRELISAPGGKIRRRQ